MSEFFHMGGYAFFVWSAYALAFIILIFNLVLPLHLEHKLLRAIARARTKRRL